MRQFRVLVNGNEYNVAIEEIQEGVEKVAATPSSRETRPAPPKAAAAPQPKPAAKKAGDGQGSASGTITAAMPGTILDIRVSVGDSVTRGQTLLILEAMKMENEIMAPTDGVIGEIFATKGASVNSGDLLIVMS